MKINKCSGSCNIISNPYAKVCVPNVAKNIPAKVFDLMTWKNKTKQINKDKCSCECLVNKKCDNGFVWNPSSCRCEYKKTSSFIKRRNNL